jgi:DNA polymerase-3 subunit gamma/tau
MAHQSLYRRYRPQRFSALRGQEHVSRALRNALTSDTVGHAYLLSGPRGTGKTTTARLLAKALNCTNLQDGEPCGECDSCVAMEAGASYDLFELDAASNNRVETMRELVSSAAVGSPGQRKVYILDEVHMLSSGAANTLLKTLEEPPDHVVFVLATTDPHKVLPTIRSRCQHFEFSLLSAEELEDYVRWVIADAGLDLDDEAVAHVIRVGRGSARDTLSALDQVAAAGEVLGRVEPVSEIIVAVADADTQRAIVAVADAVGRGSDPRVLGESLLSGLRDAFLAAVGADLSHLSDADRTAAAEVGRRVSTATLTRAMEALGTALIDMRQAADPRIPLEVALIRITDASTDTSLAGLAERVERLERGAPTAGPAPTAQERTTDSSPSSGKRPSGAAAARAELAQRKGGGEPRAEATSSAPPPPPRRRKSAAATTVAPAAPEAPDAADAGPAEDATPPDAPEVAAHAAPPPAPAPPATSAAAGDLTVEQVAHALSSGALVGLKGMAKAIYQGGRVVAVDGDRVVIALGNAPTRDRAEKLRPDVEAALAAHFGRPVPLHLVEESEAAKFEAGAASGAPDTDTNATPRATRNDAAAEVELEHESIDLEELTDAAEVPASAADKLTKAFPGAVVVEEG